MTSKFPDRASSSFGLHVARYAMVLALLSGTSAAAADQYLLGPMDKLKVRVVEWQSAAGTFRDWEALNGEYAVGPTGLLSMPLVGEIEAQGRTTSDISAAISDRLQRNLGLTDRPEAALEIAEFRPIYVAGDVQSPGAFPFAPGLTVNKAISLAGGGRRSADQNLRIGRDFVQAFGSREVLAAEYNRLLARKARFEAELAGKADIVSPAELLQLPGGAALIADEKAILTADAQKLARQLRSLDELKTLLESQVGSLAEKRESWLRQLEVERAELKNVNSLAGRGLVVATRVSDIQRSVSDIEGRLLDLDIASLRARQDISAADQNAVGLRSDRTAELAANLQQVDADLEAVRLKLDTQQGLINEARSIEPAAALAQDGPQPVYTVGRTIDGKAVELAVQGHSQVLPGDIIEMRLQTPATSY